MSDSSLSRNAGGLALAAGAAFALVELGRWAFDRPDDRIGAMADPRFLVFNGAYFVAFVGLAVALVALYSQLAPRTGRFGLVAFVAALGAGLIRASHGARPVPAQGR